MIKKIHMFEHFNSEGKVKLFEFIPWNVIVLSQQIIFSRQTPG